MCTIRGTEDIVSPHGIPLDLLDRLMIIRTQPYTLDEVTSIVRIRAKTEGIEVEEDAIRRISELGASTASLRYAVQLLTPSAVLSKLSSRSAVNQEDVDEVKSLFLDAKSSAKMLSQYESRYIH
jgi:RuvB-like protein 1 (pontin 52)